MSEIAHKIGLIFSMIGLILLFLFFGLAEKTSLSKEVLQEMLILGLVSIGIALLSYGVEWFMEIGRQWKKKNLIGMVLLIVAGILGIIAAL
ncbi:hypothetical protein LQU94_05245 [Peptoniphilus sp. KCTC 25270]|uniref:hypothetical protein n=1 Tax=Peptoniphilus sp. KCTC 25270 TaxID=2897414 RepID=UPI001E2B8E39|nr:hypothetical protein [Peptoniphilus sp. KCTC 25270]MCD1147514.1 hypothetical protein [Peptoniphilus sp. KCTC 25270]